MYKAVIRIFYPLQEGKMVIHSEKNWDRELNPVCVDKDSHCYEFHISHDKYYLSFKPCIRLGPHLLWSRGMNKLAIMGMPEVQDFYPYFYDPEEGTISGIVELPSSAFNMTRKFRIYMPPGYNENILKRYSVIYMHDGKNLFFPEEAFLGQDWKINNTLEILDRMNFIDQAIVAGIYAEDRLKEYTKPGYETYGRFIVEELKPWIDSNYRTMQDRDNNFIIGSSLGGVLSFYLAWQWPEVFGGCACLSSTFSWKDDLIERVEKEPLLGRANLKFYLDSGWPADNYEVTLKMAMTLISRGYNPGRDFLYLAFPLASHSEYAWRERVHIPLQIFAGKIRRNDLPGNFLLRLSDG